MAVLVVCAADARAQIQDAELGEPELVVAFEDAVSVGASAGDIYVVDASAGTLTRLGIDSLVATVFAGASSRLVGPADVDPTHGLTVWLSDAAASRLYRLTREFAVIETIDLRSVAEFGASRVEEGIDTVTDPRHIAIVDERTIVMIDGRSSRVVWWSRDRGFVRYRGGDDAREPGLEPVGVVSTPRSVVVADQASGCLLTFDSIGALLGPTACDTTSTIVAISRSSRRLWITRRFEGGTLIESRYDDGRLVQRFRVPSDLSVREAVGASGRVWMIGEGGLYVAAVPDPLQD